VRDKHIRRALYHSMHGRRMTGRNPGGEYHVRGSGPSRNHIELFDEATSVVEFNSKSWGVPILWYPDLKHGLYTKNRPDAPLTRLEYSQKYGATYLAMCMLYGSIPVAMNADREATIFRRVTVARHAFGMSAPDMVFHPYWQRSKQLRIVQTRAVKGSGEPRKEAKASVYLRNNKLLIVLVNFDSRPANTQVILADELLGRTYENYRLRDCEVGRDVELVQATSRAGKMLPGRRARIALPGHGFALLLGEAGQASVGLLPGE